MRRLLVVVAALLVVSCAPLIGEQVIRETVEVTRLVEKPLVVTVQVTRPVVQTKEVTVLVTQPPLPTYTPLPTHTAYPTPTRLPTYTPYPTPIPPPTYTPYPTSTSLPTHTPLPTVRYFMKVKLYYYNQPKGEAIGDPCSPDAVLPVVRRIPVTITPIQDTIRLLVRGQLTEEEKKAGFATKFPHSGFRLLGANLKDGVLTLEFTEVPGFTDCEACRAGLLAAQIRKTAKQFRNVSQVEFKPAELFQP